MADKFKNELLTAVADNNLKNVIQLREYFENHSDEFTFKNITSFHQTISNNADVFSLYFDANYQMGYRYNRKPKFDKETGEILEETE
ncbi:ATP synthase subunit delta [Lactiplantibacillus plantarum]|uniref:hypothetical protein n=1 Tax=Lactiplantibacillus plantarum TaxID=1590 RepID=UPI000B3D2B3A|nr:hypothetical protein [Lactiplantibacillus plantarum]OUT04791.1 ATP synthase subunit delta [Lactiplantibacillus plantarum]